MSQIAGNKDKSYKFDESLSGQVHMNVHKKEFDSSTGEAVHAPYNYICNPKAYLQFLQYPHGLSIVKMLHLPTGTKTPEAWAKDQAAKKK